MRNMIFRIFKLQIWRRETPGAHFKSEKYSLFLSKNEYKIHSNIFEILETNLIYLISKKKYFKRLSYFNSFFNYLIYF